MDDTIHYLPLLCQRLIGRQLSRRHVPRWLLSARDDWLRRQEAQKSVHRRWAAQPLRRHERLLKNEALTFAQEYTLCIDHALAHLARFAESGLLTEVYRAMARWRRAERAREDYMERRALLERTALEWREERAA